MGIFTVEMCVKILADGFVMHKGSYLRFVQANPYCNLRTTARLTTKNCKYYAILGAHFYAENAKGFLKSAF